MNTQKWGDVADTLCPVARSSAVVGDRWTMLIVRELFAGSTRFDDIQAQTGASPQMLSARLKRLEEAGMVERREYSRRPVRHEYALTPKGADFFPVILALRAWGETWCKDRGEPLAVRTTHRTCGGDVGLDGTCSTCQVRVAPTEMESEPTPEYSTERRQRREAYRTQSQRPAPAARGER